MSDDANDYAPFPEQDLLAVAEFHDSVAKHHPERSYLRHIHEERAAVCRSAIKSHNALRERFLEAQTQYRIELGSNHAA